MKSLPASRRREQRRRGIGFASVHFLPSFSRRCQTRLRGFASCGLTGLAQGGSDEVKKQHAVPDTSAPGAIHPRAGGLAGRSNAGRLKTGTSNRPCITGRYFFARDFFARAVGRHGTAHRASSGGIMPRETSVHFILSPGKRSLPRDLEITIRGNDIGDLSLNLVSDRIHKTVQGLFPEVTILHSRVTPPREIEVTNAQD